MRETGHILIVDDDLDYSYLLQVAFEEARVANPIRIIRDGRSAVNYFKQMGAAASAGIINLPALVLLDWRLPGLDGFEVLSLIRRDPRLSAVPVLLFTGIESGEQRSHARELGASLLLKPFSYRELVQMVEAFRARYLEPLPLPQAA